MKNFIIFILLIFHYGCISIGGGQNYLTTESREGKYKFEILTPHNSSITLPGDPNAWVDIGVQDGWYTFKNTSNNDTVQYINKLKNKAEFYSEELNNNEKYINKYYDWETEYFLNSGIINRTGIIKKEINEDDEDYILIDVLRNDEINHFIYFSIRKGRVVAVSIRSSDPKEIVLSRIEEIYNSTK